MKRIIYILISLGLVWPSLALGQTTSALGQTPSPPVLITEIQLEGVTSTDEFVEIYNAGIEPINIAGWRLSKKTASGAESNLLTDFPEALLSPGAFLLISHENYIGSPAADLKFSTQNSLADNNTVILYSDSGDTIVDQVGLGTAANFLGQAAANPDKGFSLQRKLNGQIFSNTSNNLADFLAAAPTPKTFTASLTLPPPSEAPPASEIAPAPSAAPNLPASPSPAPPSPVLPPPPSSGSGPRLIPNKPTKPKIIFNELFPNPIGSDREEFIELKNIGSLAVDLSFWQIKNNRAVFTFEPEIFSSRVIFPNEIFLLKRSETGLALYNAEDKLKLLDSENDAIDKISYEDAPEGASLIRDNLTEHWRWSAKPTPSQENIYEKIAHKPVADAQIIGDLIAGEPIIFDGSDSFDSNGETLKFSWEIKGPQTKPSSKIIKEDEIVSLVLDAAGKYHITLKVTDPTGKIDQIKKNVQIKKNPFAPEPPDQSKETGSKVKSQSVKSSAVQNKSAQSKKSPPDTQAIIITASQLKEYLGKVVTVSGEVVEIAKTKFFVFDQTGDAAVNFGSWKRTYSPEAIKIGAKATATGTVKTSGGVPYIMPRSREDLKFEAPTKPTSIAAPSRPKAWILPSIYLSLAFLMISGWLIGRRLKLKA